MGILNTTGLRGSFSTGPASFGVGSLPQGDHKGTDWCFSGGYLQCWLSMQGSRDVLSHCSDTCRPRLNDAVLIRCLNFLMSPRVPPGWVLATCVSPQEMIRHNSWAKSSFLTLVEETDKNCPPFFMEMEERKGELQQPRRVRIQQLTLVSIWFSGNS